MVFVHVLEAAGQIDFIRLNLKDFYALIKMNGARVISQIGYHFNKKLFYRMQ